MLALHRRGSLSPGHVFVLQCNAVKLACDALLIPCGGTTPCTLPCMINAAWDTATLSPLTVRACATALHVSSPWLRYPVPIQEDQCKFTPPVAGECPVPHAELFITRMEPTTAATVSWWPPYAPLPCCIA